MLKRRNTLAIADQDPSSTHYTHTTDARICCALLNPVRSFRPEGRDGTKTRSGETERQQVAHALTFTPVLPLTFGTHASALGFLRRSCRVSTLALYPYQQRDIRRLASLQADATRQWYMTKKKKKCHAPLRHGEDFCGFRDVEQERSGISRTISEEMCFADAPGMHLALFLEFALVPPHSQKHAGRAVPF